MEHGQETMTIVDENGVTSMYVRSFSHSIQKNSVNHMYFIMY